MAHGKERRGAVCRGGGGRGVERVVGGRWWRRRRQAKGGPGKPASRNLRELYKYVIDIRDEDGVRWITRKLVSRFKEHEPGLSRARGPVKKIKRDPIASPFS